MRLTKCFTLLSVFSIMLGLSFVVSSDVSALMHDVKYIPIASESVLSYGTTSVAPENPDFEVHWHSENAPSSVKLNLNHYFVPLYDSSRNLCVFQSYQSTYHTLPSFDGTNYSFGFNTWRYNLRSADFNDYFCRQTAPFGTLLSSDSNITSHPNFDESSIVNIPIADRAPYTSLLPYTYDYDSLYVHDSAVDTSTGVTYNNSLKFSEFIGSPINKPDRLVIPLGRANSDVVGTISLGRKVKLTGVFDFSGEGNYVNFTSASDSYFRLYYGGYDTFSWITDSTHNVGGYTDCSLNNITLPSTGFNQLEFTCEFESPYDFLPGRTWFSLRLFAGSSDYIFDTNADWSFSSAYFITDNDETPGGTWGDAPTGNNLSSAPGSAEGLIPQDQDFFNKLVNLFAFNVSNPFAGLLDMIHDPNSCASIPTLAGMLNAEESTYCPWFPTSVRNVLTPVLSIAGMMLVFGFFVRWLGARSGNFIEDSGGIDSGGYHFENKFRRKK